ncbi:prevent-host-death protein [Flavobacterium psychrophilum]|nr:prevent-host-death protein [Flavobacterium psychrophilum]ELY2018460.1 prevent-host-death protein [Flavobacterium psychrophilum]MBM4676156.1 prevent-host-death protein [Flavobacterium psychrophilum]MCB5973050.1 prevent-host-death protein [Flavobacterium psychrophilum]MCB5973054.1 prevent-host-death protein [Flavobacterium psychrophilum]MCB5979304.1 prevent-host-death protein [Flavobacterium psychrophilum]
MIVISSREFRDHQKKYFDLIDTNEQVIVQRGKNKSYKLVPVLEDDTLMTEAEFYAKIDKSIEQVKNGQVTRIAKEDLKSFLGL